ncbi:helix-turn-helix transcriptional regulator [Desulfobacter postgatei]|mgnify:CR=1 FL=1|uniref:helix-turn-helix transcriptional regulator n=1 Tax=Desulfobacter postgatei TaxID=2293 RepID=UPI00259BCD66|nr:helix-turn-helix transcriptional regulator [uncultured Desulfobacter sp.]
MKINNMRTKKKTKNTEPYARNLKAHIEKQPYGYITKLAKEAGISQGYLSNIADGKREGSETVRRTLAQKIGIPYDEMIGLKGPSSPESESETKTEVESDGDKEMEAVIKHLLSEHKKERAELNKKIEDLIAENKDLAVKVKELEMRLQGMSRAPGSNGQTRDPQKKVKGEN